MGQDTSSKVIQRRPAFAIVTDNPAFSGIPSPSLQLKPPKPPPPRKIIELHRVGHPDVEQCAFFLELFP